MKIFMNILLPTKTALDIHDNIAGVLKTLNESYAKEKPLTLEEWRKAVNMLMAFQIAVEAAVRQEEAND